MGDLIPVDPFVSFRNLYLFTKHAQRLDRISVKLVYLVCEIPVQGNITKKVFFLAQRKSNEEFQKRLKLFIIL